MYGVLVHIHVAYVVQLHVYIKVHFLQYNTVYNTQYLYTCMYRYCNRTTLQKKNHYVISKFPPPSYICTVLRTTVHIAKRAQYLVVCRGVLRSGKKSQKSPSKSESTQYYCTLWSSLLVLHVCTRCTTFCTVHVCDIHKLILNTCAGVPLRRFRYKYR